MHIIHTTNDARRHATRLSAPLATALLAALATACSPADDPSPSAPQAGHVMHIALKPDTWTYLSLRQGTTVGTSALADDEADTQWASRTDWDIALCNGHIRTNSGTSGHSQGGIAVSPADYDATVTTGPHAFHTDADTVHIARQQ